VSIIHLSILTVLVLVAAMLIIIWCLPKVEAVDFEDFAVFTIEDHTCVISSQGDFECFSPCLKETGGE